MGQPRSSVSFWECATQDLKDTARTWCSSLQDLPICRLNFAPVQQERHSAPSTSPSMSLLKCFDSVWTNRSAQTVRATETMTQAQWCCRWQGLQHMPPGTVRRHLPHPLQSVCGYVWFPWEACLPQKKGGLKAEQQGQQTPGHGHICTQRRWDKQWFD